MNNYEQLFLFQAKGFKDIHCGFILDQAIKNVPVCTGAPVVSIQWQACVVQEYTYFCVIIAYLLYVGRLFSNMRVKTRL